MRYHNQIIQTLKDNKSSIARNWVTKHLAYSDVVEQLSLFSQTQWVEQLIDVIILLLQTADDLAAEVMINEFASEQIRQQKDINSGIETFFIGKQLIIKCLLDNYSETTNILQSGISQIDQVVNLIILIFIDKYQSLALSGNGSKEDLIRKTNTRPSFASYPPLEVHSVVKEMTWTILRTLDAKQALVYLKDKNEDFFNPFFALGDLTVIDKRTFNTEFLEIYHPEFVQKLLIEKDPIFSDQDNLINQIPLKVIKSIQADSVLLLPIASKNHSLGIAILCNLPEDSGILQEQIQLASTITHSMGLALENELLYEEKKKRLAETESIRQITFALLQKYNLEEVLEIVCTEAQRLTNARGSAVYLLQDDQWLEAAFQSGETSHTTDRLIALRESILGLAVLQNKPVFVNNQGQSEDNPTLNPVSLLAVPLQINNEPVGLLEVFKKHYGFSKDDIRIIKLFAGQAGIAIENARLYQQAEQIAILEERQRLARNLHDSLNQSIFGVTLYAKAASRQLDANRIDKAQENIKNLIETAKVSLGEMRLIVYELHPPHLEEKGLLNVIRERLKTVESRVGIQFELNSNIENKLPSSIEDELYWIAQESLNNVLKHSDASKVIVNIMKSDDKLVMEIIDDGIGFNFDERFASEGHIGLKSMYDRAKIINAEIRIDSQPKDGTRVSVEVTL